MDERFDCIRGRFWRVPPLRNLLHFGEHHPLLTSRMPTLTLLGIVTSSLGAMVAAEIFPAF
jgi:hypothetical protein